MKKYLKIFGIVFGLFTLEVLMLIFFKSFETIIKMRAYNKIKIYGCIFGATVSMVSLYYFRKIFNLNFQYKINGKVEIFRSKNNLIIIGFFLLLYLAQIVMLSRFNNEAIILNIRNLFVLFLVIVATDLLYYRYYLFLKRHSKKFRIVFTTIMLISIFMSYFFINYSGYFSKFIEDMSLYIFYYLLYIFVTPVRDIMRKKELESYIFGVFKNVQSEDKDNCENDI